MFKLQTFSTLTIVFGLFLLLSGCDSAIDAELTDEPTQHSDDLLNHNTTQTLGWQGLSVTVEEGFALTNNDRLRIETEDDRHAHFRIQPSSEEQMDLLFSLDAIERGDPFVIKVIGRDDSGTSVVLSEILHRPTDEDGKVDLSHAVTQGHRSDVTCRIGDTTPESIIDDLTDAKDTLEMGTLNDWPTSFHYIRRGDAVVIEIDYEREMELTNLQTAQLSLDQNLVANHIDDPSVESPQKECSHIGFHLSGIPASTQLHAVEMSLPRAIDIAQPEH